MTSAPRDPEQERRFDSERERLARGIHEELAPLMLDLGFRIARLRRGLSKPAPEMESARRQSSELSECLDRLFVAFREFADRLYPQDLGSLGLDAALESQLREFAESTGIDARFSAERSFNAAHTLHGIDMFRECESALALLVAAAEVSKIDATLKQNDAAVVMKIVAVCAAAPKGENGETRRSSLSHVGDRLRRIGGDGVVDLDGGTVSLTLTAPIVR